MKLFLSSISICILLLLSCNKSTDTTPTPTTPKTPSIKGSWTGGAGTGNYDLDFTDTTYSFGSSGFTLESGTYTQSGNTLNFIMDNSSLCSPSTSPFKYTFSITGSTLKMTKVTDNCTFRSASFAGNFTK